jgi:ABC-type cobalamin/Fe3+-siderophores transport system ATPase subunit
MVATTDLRYVDPLGETLQRLTAFEVEGLFNGPDHKITFPESSDDDAEANLLILSGVNGAGKTTILKMIEGMLALNFDVFRAMPFRSAKLILTGGHVLTVVRRKDDILPLRVSFGSASALLAMDGNSGPEQIPNIMKLRELALPVLRTVQFELLAVDRAYTDIIDRDMREDPRRRIERPDRREERLLAYRIRRFMAEAQLDYRKFFRANELDLLPRILDSIQHSSSSVDIDNLTSRIGSIKAALPTMKRYGLQTDEESLTVLENLIGNGSYQYDQRSIAIINTYLETQESVHKSRELIARRLVQFEEIMDEFLVGKTVKLDARLGLVIVTSDGKRLEEKSLSSGEYHFLYMMVAALLCQRVGSIIAIDEPELSLHVTWQRKLVGALMKCAEGASPLFLLATHSMQISAEHADRVYHLSALEH